MIEKESALEELEGILGTPGVDMVVFGPGDYAMNVGLTGEIGHPRVREAEEHVIATAHRMGVAFRAEIDRPEDAKRYLDLGVRHFAVGVDTVVLFDYWKRAGSAVLEALGREAPGAAAGRPEAT
jgi:4-hydroxy-2-oxoheptanedioate aldolase